MRHGTYWKVVSGQLSKNERVFCGCKIKSKAEENAAREPGKATIRLLRTREHDLPSDHPDFNKNQIFDSERWCVIGQLSAEELYAEEL